MQKNREILEKRPISDYISSEVIEKILQICPNGNLLEVECATCGNPIFKKDRNGNVDVIYWDTFLDDNNEIMCEECWKKKYLQKN